MTVRMEVPIGDIIDSGFFGTLPGFDPIDNYRALRLILQFLKNRGIEATTSRKGGYGSTPAVDVVLFTVENPNDYIKMFSKSHRENDHFVAIGKTNDDALNIVKDQLEIPNSDFAIGSVFGVPMIVFKATEQAVAFKLAYIKE